MATLPAAMAEASLTASTGIGPLRGSPHALISTLSSLHPPCAPPRTLAAPSSPMGFPLSTRCEREGDSWTARAMSKHAPAVTSL
eukprot:CAMPEP_0172066614 /NCGR_PEP_ID=MMETSP1043-20130122/11252_1 /TAXON_ID=464988 /ORGANISM="Hemiselmis andersenii, Strain CCMP441" /LENGTH=83 /DNA_ID=CAMNT_0012726779 /DNA_START=51 /DNA_END=302 /DNA_ORIENTATION=+